MSESIPISVLYAKMVGTPAWTDFMERLNGIVHREEAALIKMAADQLPTLPYFHQDYIKQARKIRHYKDFLIEIELLIHNTIIDSKENRR